MPRSQQTHLVDMRARDILDELQTLPAGAGGAGVGERVRGEMRRAQRNPQSRNVHYTARPTPRSRPSPGHLAATPGGPPYLAVIFMSSSTFPCATM